MDYTYSVDQYIIMSLIVLASAVVVAGILGMLFGPFIAAFVQPVLRRVRKRD